MDKKFLLTLIVAAFTSSGAMAYIIAEDESKTTICPEGMKAYKMALLAQEKKLGKEQLGTGHFVCLGDDAAAVLKDPALGGKIVLKECAPGDCQW